MTRIIKFLIDIPLLYLNTSCCIMSIVQPSFYICVVISLKRKISNPPLYLCVSQEKFEWIEEPANRNIKQGTCDEISFTCKLSHKGKKAKWYLRNQVRHIIIIHYRIKKLVHIYIYIVIHKLVGFRIHFLLDQKTVIFRGFVYGNPLLEKA